MLEGALAYFHADTDPAVRSDVLSITRCVIQRLRGAISQLSREVEKVRTSELHRGRHQNAQRFELIADSEYLMAKHVNFLEWYINFLKSELVPTASYQRHITALKALTILLQSGVDRAVAQGYLSKLAQRELKWSFALSVFSPTLIRLLFDLSMDPFDDVRHAAVLVLKMHASTLGDNRPKPSLTPPSSPPPSVRRTGVESSCSSTGSVSGQPTLPSLQDRPLNLHVRLRNEAITSYLLNSTKLATTNCSNNSSAAQKLPQGQQQSAKPDLLVILSRAQDTLHRTGRADHADGVARLCDVLDACSATSPTGITKGGKVEAMWWSTRLSIAEKIVSQLEDGVLLARSNLWHAVAGAPIHGDLAALR